MATLTKPRPNLFILKAEKEKEFFRSAMTMEQMQKLQEDSKRLERLCFQPKVQK